eukprot:5540149-Pleurochrysis_carterae.AAC.1
MVLGRACAVARGGALTRRRRPLRASLSKSLGNGARALREYACYASLKRQQWSVQVIVDLEMRGARDDSL